MPAFAADSNCCSVFGLEVVLLASPFSTVVCCWLLLAELFGVVQVATVLVAVVVFRFVALRIPTDWEDAPDWEVVIRDLNVGVTVAEGLVDAGVLALLVSFRGLIGVDAPHVVILGRRAALDDTPDDVEDMGLLVDNIFDVFEDVVFEFTT